MNLNLNCKETSRLLSQAQDGKLRLTERIALRIHLRVCDACTQFSQQLEFLRRAMLALPGPEAGDAAAGEKNTR